MMIICILVVELRVLLAKFGRTTFYPKLYIKSACFIGIIGIYIIKETFCEYLVICVFTTCSTL